MKFIAIAALSISATAFFCMQTAHASGHSAPVQASAPLAGAVPAGEGVLRFWGLEIYHARLWVPPGFAHGFVVLSEMAEFLYKTTDYYAPQFERCIAWNDPDLAIDWPNMGMAPLLSAKDFAGRKLSNADCFN